MTVQHHMINGCALLECRPEHYDTFMCKHIASQRWQTFLSKTSWARPVPETNLLSTVYSKLQSLYLDVDIQSFIHKIKTRRAWISARTEWTIITTAQAGLALQRMPFSQHQLRWSVSAKLRIRGNRLLKGSGVVLPGNFFNFQNLSGWLRGGFLAIGIAVCLALP